MKRFEYADESISEKEILVAVASMIIGIGVLSLPKQLAKDTIASDGWIALLVGGFIVIGITWAVARLAATFPGQEFITYATKLTAKPIAIVLTSIHVLITMNVVAIQIREIGEISKHYLFDRTPVEVISLAFFLVVIYAVAGSRVGLFRLNMMFLPIFLFIAVAVLVFSLGKFEIENLFPVFKTDFMNNVKAIGTSVTSYVGFGILWFYLSLVRQPKKAPKMAALGVFIPIGLYLVIFIICIGVFGNAVSSNLLYPTIELAKSVEIPGEVFERFESIFFVIWIMAIFNTTSMAFDIVVFATNSIFKRAKKIWLIFVFSPIIFAVSMLPQDTKEIDTYSTVISISWVSYTVFIILLFFLMYKIRRVKGNE